MELCSTLCCRLDGRGVWRRMDTCIYMGGLPRWYSDKRICLSVQEMQEMQVLSLVQKEPGVGNGNPLQYCCLDNPIDRGAWQATVHGVSKSWMVINDWACICMAESLCCSSETIIVLLIGYTQYKIKSYVKKKSWVWTRKIWMLKEKNKPQTLHDRMTPNLISSTL